MANTVVTDAFLQSNVTMNVADNLKRPQSEGFSFEKVMTETTSKNQQTGEKEIETENSAKPNMKIDKSHKNPDAEKVSDKQQDNKEKTIAEETDNTEETEKLGKVAEEITDKAETIKDKIKDAFEVTDEEISEVMATLGIAVQNLINPEDLKQVMMGVSGIEDSMELLTNENIYTEMQNILEYDSEVTNQIAEEFHITKDEVVNLIEDTEAFNKLQAVTPESEIIPKEMPIVENSEQEETAETQKDFSEINIQGAENGMMLQKQEMPDAADNVKETAAVRENDTRDYKLDETNSNSTVTVINQSEKTDSLKKIAATGKSDDAGEQNMASMNEVKTTVTINAEGNIVETVERFSEGLYDAREIVSQVTESIKMNISADTTSMEMMLHPATLGTVNMQISSQNGVITAHLLVQNEAVKSALETQLVILQETFEEQGQQVEAIEVTVANYNLDRGMQNGSNEQERENALRSGRIARKRLKLDEISEEEFEELEADDKVTADMMRRQGNSVNFMA